MQSTPTGSRPGGNCASGSAFQREPGQLDTDTSPNLSSQHLTKQSLRSPLHNGNKTYNDTSNTTEHPCHYNSIFNLTPRKPLQPTQNSHHRVLLLNISTSFSRMQAVTNTTSHQGPAPMGKIKGSKGSKGYSSNSSSNNNNNKGYGKSGNGAIGQGNAFKGGKGYTQSNKGNGKAPPPPPYNKGKSKDISKCGQPGHIATAG